MENFALITLVEELKRTAAGMVVRRVIQHHADGFILETRAVRMPGLKIGLDSRHSALYVSRDRPPSESVTTDFLMVLRKHFVAAALVEIHKPLSERIVELRFKTSLPARELEHVVLVVELLPNAANLILLDRARRVLASFRPLGSSRGLGEYDEYRYPEVRKIELERTREADPSWFDAVGFAATGRDWLVRNLAGLGPVFADEAVHRMTRTGQTLPEVLRGLVNRLLEPSRTAWVYSLQPLAAILGHNDVEMLRRTIVSPIELESLRRTHSAQTYPGVLEAARAFFDELESRTLLDQAKLPRLRRLRADRRRLAERKARLLDRQRRFEQASELQASARMLLTSGAAMDRHHEAVEVTDYFGPTPRQRLISVDPSRTLRENVARMFKEHQRSVRGLGMVERQLADLAAGERKLEAEEHRIRGIGDWNAWMAVGGSAEIRRPGAGEKKPVPRAKGRRSLRIGGREVLVGRSGRENDELTFRIASGDDFWLHVADYSGSHVIVRNPSRDLELEASVLTRAAELAAYYSQARNSPKVDVHYTFRKFLAKPKKGKPGLVRLREYKTITVEPRNWIDRGLPPEKDGISNGGPDMPEDAGGAAES